MSDLVVDTDVVSFMFKRDSRSRLYRPHLIGRTGYICFMTVSELSLWSRKHHWGAARVESFARYLQRFVVIGCDHELCEYWAEVTYQAQATGRPIQCADAWIAATALSLDAPLITNNPADFAGVPGLTIITAP